MVRYALIVCLLLVPALTAQEIYPNPLEDIQVGQAYTFHFGEGFDEIFQTTPEVEFFYSFTVTSGSLPPGMTLLRNGLYSGVPRAAGNYAWVIKFTLGFRVEGESFEFTINLDTTQRVVAGTGAPVILDPTFVMFSFVDGAGAGSQSLVLTNRATQAQTYTATATTVNGGNWLSVTPASGSVAPFSGASLTVSANPAGLGPGTYTGVVTVSTTPSGDRPSVPVILTITSNRQALLLSQTGLTFAGVSGGGTPPPQSFQVLNAGAGTLRWTAVATMLSGAGWLAVTPASGTSDATTRPTVQVTVTPAGLAAGSYYGQIRVSSDDASNSPQTVAVVVNVAPAGVNPGPIVQPSGLIFVGTAGGANPAVKGITLYNLGQQPLTFSSTTFVESGPLWFSYQPRTGSVVAGQPLRIDVQPNLAGLAAGVYRGELTLRFSDTTVYRIDLVLVVIPRPPGAGALAAAGCTPTKLIPVFSFLGSTLRVNAGHPTPIEVQVVDDCGDPMPRGSVVASFSNNDPSLALSPLGEGRFSGTWVARNASPSTIVSVRAQLDEPRIEGAVQTGRTLLDNPNVPVISAGGAVSAASFASRAPLSPGGFVAIFGAQLSDNGLADRLPLVTDLGGTQVLMAGRLLPLYFTSGGQINAILPYDLPANTTQQLLVRRGNRLSVPEPVPIAAAQPAVYTKNLSGRGEGIIVVARADGSTPNIASATNPASAGDVLVIYCAGLGPVDPPVAAGAAAPADRLTRTVNAATVTIGGRSAPVAFAGLTAGLAGLYQINATVPAGVTPGLEVPIVVTVAGQSSPPVTIAIR